MTNPLSTVLLVAAQGAAGKLVERGIDAGLEWVRAHLGRYGDETQARAEANQHDFLRELANRVQRMEEDFRANGQEEPALEDRLTDPDFSAMLQDALIASARTGSADKHSLLAQAVATRLGAPPESAEAVLCTAAVEVIPRLTHNQLNILGLLTFMHRVTPAPGWPGRSLSSDQVLRTLHEHWTWALSPYVRAIEPRAEDLSCLASLGCISYLPNIYSDVRSVMMRGIARIPERETFIEQFLATDCGRDLARLWSAGFQSAYPEQLGALLGSAVHFLRTGVRPESERSRYDSSTRSS